MLSVYEKVESTRITCTECLVYILIKSNILSNDNFKTMRCVWVNQAACICDGVAREVKVNSALQAEAYAIREACYLVSSRQAWGTYIFSDSKVLVSLLNLELVPPWEVTALVQDIKKMGADFGVSFCFVPRNLNRAAHWVANQMSRGTLPPNWMSVIPP